MFARSIIQLNCVYLCLLGLSLFILSQAFGGALCGLGIWVAVSCLFLVILVSVQTVYATLGHCNKMG